MIDFNKEAWQGSIHYIAVTAQFEWSTKVAYFWRPRSVIPIALQFASWKSYAQPSLKREEKDQQGITGKSCLHIFFYESFYMLIASFFLHFCYYQIPGSTNGGTALFAVPSCSLPCLWEKQLPLRPLVMQTWFLLIPSLPWRRVSGCRL